MGFIDHSVGVVFEQIDLDVSPNNAHDFQPITPRGFDVADFVAQIHNALTADCEP